MAKSPKHTPTQLRALVSLQGGELYANGKRVGHRLDNGYRQVKIEGAQYQEHRVIFALVHGRWPTQFIDHINRVRDDNRPENLREATPSQNQRNSNGPQKGNRCGYRGVWFCRSSNRWRAQIQVCRKKISLGCHDSPEAAHAAYVAAEKQFGGEFAPQAAGT